MGIRLNFATSKNKYTCTDESPHSNGLIFNAAHLLEACGKDPIDLLWLGILELVNAAARNSVPTTATRVKDLA